MSSSARQLISTVLRIPLRPQSSQNELNSSVADSFYPLLVTSLGSHLHIGHSQIVSISLDPIHELQTPSFRSFSTVLRHVVLGRPFFHLPSGAHVNATFPSFSWSSLSIRPIILHLLALTFFSVILFRNVHEGLHMFAPMDSQDSTKTLALKHVD